MTFSTVDGVSTISHDAMASNGFDETTSETKFSSFEQVYHGQYCPFGTEEPHPNIVICNLNPCQ